MNAFERALDERVAFERDLRRLASERQSCAYSLNVAASGQPAAGAIVECEGANCLPMLALVNVAEELAK
jgi:hypothetical protein